MVKVIAALLGIVLSLAGASAIFAGPGEAQICVAHIDGAPVFHWRVFTSSLPDDVDRALILREFHRRDFKLPTTLVDDELRRRINQEYDGDKTRLIHFLEQRGVDLTDYRRFLSEEIIISAMLYQNMKVDPRPHQTEWLARLRKGTRIEMGSENPNQS